MNIIQVHDPVTMYALLAEHPDWCVRIYDHYIDMTDVSNSFCSAHVPPPGRLFGVNGLDVYVSSEPARMYPGRLGRYFPCYKCALFS